MRYFRKGTTLSLILLASLSAISQCNNSARAQSTRERQLAARDHVNQGNYLMGQNHFQEAIDEYKKALEIDPTNSVAKDNIITCHINWGNFYVRQRKYNEALKEYQTCLILNPYNPKALNNINVVKATMSREAAAARARGEVDDSQASSESPGEPRKAAAPKKEPSSAVILTPGVKIGGSGSTAASGQAAAEAAGSDNSTSYDDAGATGQANSTSQGPSQPEPKSTSTGAAAAIIRPAASASPANSAAPQNSPAASTPGAGSLEELLAAVEVKIYGKKQADLPIFKRLEKLELDTGGQVKQGTIKERIDSLRKNYGL